jgi:hypothetical protein
VLSQEEKDKQFKHLKGWHLRLIGAEMPHAEDVLWHYTNGAGLIGIISSGTIYSTQASCLNDNSEVRYATRLVRKALLDHAGKQLGLETTQFLLKFAAFLDDTDAEPNHAGSFSYVACFSRSRDDLSQWRAYAGGENGYAIGFRARDLLGVENTLVGAVNYDAALHEALAAEVADVTVELYEKALAQRPTAEMADWTEAFLDRWGNALARIAPFAKHPGFATEREFRLVRSLTGDDYPSLIVRQKGTLLARHLPLLLPSGSSSAEQQRLPINSIVVGPARHKAVSAISVAVLLKKHGYPPDLPVYTTGIPYQLT